MVVQHSAAVYRLQAAGELKAALDGWSDPSTQIRVVITTCKQCPGVPVLVTNTQLISRRIEQLSHHSAC